MTFYEFIKFKDLKEERKFWDSHDSTDYLDDFEVAKDVVFVRPKKQAMSLRLDPNILKKLRELADEEGLPPTTFARMLIIKGNRKGRWAVKVSGNWRITFRFREGAAFAVDYEDYH